MTGKLVDNASEYKIRDVRTGLFSGGGYCPHFGPVGKSWNTLREVKLHLKMYRRGRRPGEAKRVPKTWEVVEFLLLEKLKFPTSHLL